jgi:hypothetical protein
MEGDSKLGRREARTMCIEEVEDKYWEQQARMPKAKFGILEVGDSPEEEGQGEKSGNQEIKIVAEGKDAESTMHLPLPPPPEESEPILLRPKRNPKPGDSALGISVLSVRGWIGSLEDAPVDLRLDSCADITLISEETHAALRNPPPIRWGHKMSLSQLTNKNTIIRGYTKLWILMRVVSGEIILLEPEAYVA